MDLNPATTNNIDGAAHSESFHDSQQVGLGSVESQYLLRSAFDRIRSAGSIFIAAKNHVSMGRVSLTFYQIDFARLPQPIKRQLVQLKCSDIDVPADNVIPGLKQFIGNLNDQNLYFIEHPENVFLAHMGRFIAYST